MQSEVMEFASTLLMAWNSQDLLDYLLYWDPQSTILTRIVGPLACLTFSSNVVWSCSSEQLMSDAVLSSRYKEHGSHASLYSSLLGCNEIGWASYSRRLLLLATPWNITALPNNLADTMLFILIITMLHLKILDLEIAN